MATYKVIQDIEADDKLIGPLSMKQFIFACVSAGFLFAAFMIASRTTIYAAIPFIPFIVVPGVLAAPLGRDQPTEIWLAAQLRYLIKPRKRIWNQSGIKELVNITVPKKIEKVLTKGFSEHEVRSRLKALANTLDSRGWAIKNVDINTYSPPVYNLSDNDRLVGLANMPQTVPDINVTASDDIMDYQNNSTAQHFEEMIQASSTEQRQAVMEKMRQALHEENTAQEKQKNTGKNSESEPEKAANLANEEEAVSNVESETSPLEDSQRNPDEQALLSHLQKERRKEEMAQPHHKSVKTSRQLEAEKEENPDSKQQLASKPRSPDIIEYANTNDLSVASIAQLANRKEKKQEQEVIVHLR